jgi:hypothetical protein
LTIITEASAIKRNADVFYYASCNSVQKLSFVTNIPDVNKSLQ